MTSTPTPLRIPDSMSRADIGIYMRGLREHFGLTQQDVSERLHIRVKYVNAIENAQMDAMPGQAYARGYVHTYAEFLGLDADQVVERCFGQELVREGVAHSIPEPARRSNERFKLPTGLISLVAVLLVIGVLYAAMRGEDEPASEVEEAPVSGLAAPPEAMLVKLRTRVMPTGEVVDCLEHETPLGCYRAQRLTQWWVYPERPPTPKVPMPEAKPEAKPAPKPAQKPAPKPQPKPVAKSEPAPEVKPETPEPAAEPAQ